MWLDLVDYRIPKELECIYRQSRLGIHFWESWQAVSAKATLESARTWQRLTASPYSCRCRRARTANTSAQQTRLDLVKRIVDLEKPAHTVYNIEFYWAFFRVGGSRLEQDTVLDIGSRSPKLLPPIALGGGYSLPVTWAPPIRKILKTGRS